MTKVEFIYRMASVLQELMTAGVQLNPAVAVAQAALESRWGSTELARMGNNLFSIKAGSSWTGETLILPGEEWDYRRGWARQPVVWRKYSSWVECVSDYAAILKSLPWYGDAMEHLDTPVFFLKALLPDGSNPGWATDPDYFEKIERIGLEIEALGGPVWGESSRK